MQEIHSSDDKKIYSVTIVGCGSIGALKPKGFDKIGGPPFTLAHAVFSNNRTCLTSLIDKDQRRQKLAQDKWGVKENSSNPYESDIYIVATNTENHYEVIKDYLDHYDFDSGPKVLLLEKPVCLNLREIQAIYDRVDCTVFESLTILVNYSRFYLDSYRALERQLHDSEVLSCIIHYNRGLYRDGCHAIHMAQRFFGGIRDFEILKSDLIIDNNLSDPSLMLRLYTKKCNNVFMFPVDAAHLSLFEFEILTTNGKISISWNGSHIAYRGLDLSLYGAYYGLSPDATMEESGLDNTLNEYIQSAVKVLDEESSLKVGLLDAVNVHLVLDKIKTKSAMGPFPSVRSLNSTHVELVDYDGTRKKYKFDENAWNEVNSIGVNNE